MTDTTQPWNHDPRRSLAADAGAHAVRLLAPAHAGRRGGDARLRAAARRGSRHVGKRGAAARLRLRDVPQSQAVTPARPPGLGRAPAAGAARVRGDAPWESRAW